MSLLDKVKHNNIDLDIARYVYLLRGGIKTGKTTLYADIIKEKYGTPDAGLLLPFEKGYSAIDGINVFPYTILPTTTIDGVDKHGWDIFTEIVRDLVKNRNEVPYKIICIDTVDEFMTVVCDKVCKLSIVETKKPCKSINDAYGGFGRGKAKVASLIKEQIEKLKNAGFGIFFIGHTKYKSLKTKIDNEEYNIVGSNLTEDYDKMIANGADVIAMITQEPNIVNGVITGTNRKIRFRSDGFYDVGARFATLPETIEYSAKGFIQSIEKAIKNIASIKNENEYKQAINEQNVEFKKEIEEKIKHDEDVKQKIISSLKQRLLEFTPDKKIKLKEMQTQYNIDWTKPEDITLEALIDIAEELGLSY